jgi:hypothetical protein
MLVGSDPAVALFAAAMLALVLLGWRRGRNTDDLMKDIGAAVASVSMILLIIASGGAFKQVLIDSGTGDAVKNLAAGLPVSPLILAWSAAALFRAALGSATVAAITAAGVVLPVIAGSGASPELLVLATTAGSLMFSHFNDIGFWMFKEYYNVSVRETFQIWTVMESIVAVVGLAGTLLLSTVVHAAPAAKRVAYVNSYHQGYPSRDEAAAAMKAQLAKPGVGEEDFMMPYAAFRLTKIATEQGVWAAPPRWQSSRERHLLASRSQPTASRAASSTGSWPSSPVGKSPRASTARSTRSCHPANVLETGISFLRSK